MSTYFEPVNGAITDINRKQSFDKELSLFLSKTNQNNKTNIEFDFQEIFNFLKFQPDEFLEETFLTVSAKIINHLGNQYSTYNDNLIAVAQIYLNIIKDDKFKNLVPKLNNYSNAGTFNFINNLLQSNNLVLAEQITNTFVHPEKRTLKSFNTNLIEWCLQNTKIAALKFLIHNYDGFNQQNIQASFLSHAELGEDYLTKVFPDNIYPLSLQNQFSNFFKDSSIILAKKLNLISYFSQKTEFIPKELTSFLYDGVSTNIISLESLKKYDFFDKLTSTETLLSYLEQPGYPINNLENYLNYFIPKNEKNKIAETIFPLIISNNKKQKLFESFCEKFPDYLTKNKDSIEKFILENNIIIEPLYYKILEKSFTPSEELNKFIIKNNENAYFFIRTPETDASYIDKLATYLLEKKWFPNMKCDIDSIKKPLIDKLLQKKGNDELFDFFFIQQNYHRSEMQLLLKQSHVVISKDLSVLNKQQLDSCIQSFSNEEIYKQLKNTKWYDFSFEKPLQIVYKNGDFQVIKNPADKITVQQQELDENPNQGFAIILAQSKKDLNKFNQLTSQPLDFNLEFKIRAETILMEQAKFLTQIQKIENDLAYDDLYFLKNNLGKYLIQCTETYSRALNRYQTLLDNPSFIKKSDTLDSQKEKIDNEALKQVTLLEKELDFVKQHVVETLNSDTMADMRINTRVLEATVEHPSEDASIIKLSSNKPK